MLPGKVPPDVLERLVFPNVGKRDHNLILGPAIGQDASLIRFGDKVLVVSTDPITGAVEDIGWLAVHINANDIATFGVPPKWFLNSIMLPVGYTQEDLKRIMEQIDEAANSLEISVAGGHTEITEGIDRPIIAGFMLGETSEGEYVTSAGAQPGDSIIMTKSIGLEGTAILASEGTSELSLDDDVIQEAKSLRNKISVVGEGIAAFRTGQVTAMHDPTEGGLSGGIHEICDASSVGFTLNLEKIPIHPLTQKICDELEVNAMELISSGCMLITANAEGIDDIINSINSIGVEATEIGTIVEDKNKRICYAEKKSESLQRPKSDALWGALKKITSS
ncbi:MAG: AIR synthase family protein [Candidatus Thorarchaeota archaeon]|jgi:hydrogenase maturation factor